ncbi:MAG: 30S ribosome-binding factor RbfA [Clostridia bacterium]|nr:30S ribosome-binding factor RbfA [Clostridia bacterium]
MSHRTARINDAVREELNRALAQVKDPRVASSIVSVSMAEVSGDLSTAKIYVSILGGEPSEVLKGLKAAHGFLRTFLAKSLNLRKTPALTFLQDRSAERGAHIASILKELS